MELDTRGDVADCVSGVLDSAGIFPDPGGMHSSVWSWIALVFLTKLCRRQSGNKLKVGQSDRYLQGTQWRTFYRHLVAFPVWVRAQRGALARIFLFQKAYVMPDVVEQVASRFDLITSAGVIELIDHLYWDDAASAGKPGFTDKDRPGSLRALDLVLSQMACTYDLRSMSRQQIMEKLPQEFEAFASG